MSDFTEVKHSGKASFGFEGTKVSKDKSNGTISSFKTASTSTSIILPSASTMDWAAEESDDEVVVNKRDMVADKRQEKVEENQQEDEEEDDDENESSEDEIDQNNVAVTTAATIVVVTATTTTPIIEEPKSKTRSNVPLTKKEKKLQREQELRELEQALSEFGVNKTSPDTVAHIPEKFDENGMVSNNTSSENKKKKKKKSNSSTITEKDSLTLPTDERAKVSEVSVSHTSGVKLVDPKEILLQRTRKVKKDTMSVAEKAATAELKNKSSSETDKKKKSKDKSKLGYNETSY